MCRRPLETSESADDIAPKPGILNRSAWRAPVVSYGLSPLTVRMKKERRVLVSAASVYPPAPCVVHCPPAGVECQLDTAEAGVLGSVERSAEETLGPLSTAFPNVIEQFGRQSRVGGVEVGDEISDPSQIEVHAVTSSTVTHWTLSADCMTAVAACLVRTDRGETLCPTASFNDALDEWLRLQRVVDATGAHASVRPPEVFAVLVYRHCVQALRLGWLADEG